MAERLGVTRIVGSSGNWASLQCSRTLQPDLPQSRKEARTQPYMGWQLRLPLQAPQPARSLGSPPAPLQQGSHSEGGLLQACRDVITHLEPICFGPHRNPLRSNSQAHVCPGVPPSLAETSPCAKCLRLEGTLTSRRKAAAAEAEQQGVANPQPAGRALGLVLGNMKVSSVLMNMLLSLR